MTKLYKNLLSSILLAAIFSCSSHPPADSAHDQAVLKKIKQTGVLRVGTTGDYRPFTFLDSKGNYSGLDVQMAQNLADTLGAKLELVKTSWPTLSEDLKSSKFDIAMGGISVTTEREKVGFFSVGYHASGKTPISRCEDRQKYTSLKKIDRPEVRIIENPGGTNEKFVKANLSRAKLLLYPDNNTIFDQIEKKMADVMITDSTEIQLIVRTHPKLCATTPGKTFDRSEKGYFMPKDEEWKQYVNTWLKNLMDHHAIEKGMEEALKKFSN